MEPAPKIEPDASIMACPTCDSLQRVPDMVYGAKARCSHCHTILLEPRENNVAMIVAFALAALILMVVAISFPFLRLEASGLSSQASVIDAILAFSDASPLMIPLSAVVAALILFLPIMRLAGLIYALGPLLVNRPPPAYAHLVFRVAMRLRPWAMAEIFIIGVAVALIKIAGIATVEFGPAFWAFTGLVLLVAAKDSVLCERSVWALLEQSEEA